MSLAALTIKLLSLSCPSKNLLPQEGEVYYWGPVFSPENAGFYYDKLFMEVPWKPDEAIILGKHLFTKRKIAWYGDKPFQYSYSNISREALLWSQVLLDLKKMVEALSGEAFNSCLLNLYHNGQEGMAWHSDGEKSLKKNGAIASLSLGAERKFSFKHKKTKERVSLLLEHGSLLLMKGATQAHWWHRLPPTKKAHGPRINLTFRTIAL